MTDLSTALSTPTFHMNVETATGVKPHGFHLGTVKATAMQFVYEQLRRPGVHSVALYYGNDALPFGIFDWRDLPENADKNETDYDEWLADKD